MEGVLKAGVCPALWRARVGDCRLRCCGSLQKMKFRGKMRMTIKSKINAAIGEEDSTSTTTTAAAVEECVEEEEEEEEVKKNVNLLKRAAKTKKVETKEVLDAIVWLGKAKLDSSNFLETIGGRESPGRTWMLIFTANSKAIREREDGSKHGNYFPITAVQRFDASAEMIENGVYLGGIGALKFQGRFSWSKRILAFIFDRISITVGSIGPFTFNLSSKFDKERIPDKKNDPYFIWYYADDEIIVGKGRSGGVALWVRCKRV